VSLPKRGSRKIIVESISYRWKAKGTGEYVNLVIAPLDNGQKILAHFDYDTERVGSNAFNDPFIVTPYVARAVILFAIKNGYTPNGIATEMNLGNLTKKLALPFPVIRKTKQLIKKIEQRISAEGIDPMELKSTLYNLKETKHYISYGECYIGFEMMLSNFYEDNFKVTEEELRLIKEIFQKARVDWEKDWSWIEELTIKAD